MEDAAATDAAPVSDSAPAGPPTAGPESEVMEAAAAGVARAPRARAGEAAGTSEALMGADEVDDEALLALDIDQARADAPAAAPSTNDVGRGALSAAAGERARANATAKRA